MPDVGDYTTPTLLVSPFSGTTATTLTVTAPDGTTSSPATSTADAGNNWTAVAYQYTAAGLWLEKWTVTGTGAGVQYRDTIVTDAPTDRYAGELELRARLNITHTNPDQGVLDALTAASRGIDVVCERRFTRDNTPSARIFYADQYCAYVDDFWTTTGLVLATDEAGSGTFSTIWTSTDYELLPLNGKVRGETWSYCRIKAVNRYFPAQRLRAGLSLTASWGWATVPGPVHEACLAVAEEIYKLRDSPYGVAGTAEWGTIRVRQNPYAMAMLRPYSRAPFLMA